MNVVSQASIRFLLEAVSVRKGPSLGGDKSASNLPREMLFEPPVIWKRLPLWNQASTRPRNILSEGNPFFRDHAAPPELRLFPD